MRHGRLFLAGDAAIYRAADRRKGLNLAASDIAHLSRAGRFLQGGSSAGIDPYSEGCWRESGRAERFVVDDPMLHLFPESSLFDRRIQRTEL